jgi:hypothetical protein
MKRGSMYERGGLYIVGREFGSEGLAGNTEVKAIALPAGTEIAG